MRGKRAGLLAIAFIVLSGPWVCACSEGGPTKQQSDFIAHVFLEDAYPYDQVVEGAAVEIVDLKLTGLTNADGSYLFEDVPWGYHTFVAYKSGYSGDEKVILVGVSTNGPQYMDFMIAPEDTEWLFMYYGACDYYNFDTQYAYSFNQLSAEMDSTGKIRTVAQVDRYYNWEGSDNHNARRFEILADAPPVMLEDIGEVNTGAAGTLGAFINWGMANFPAAKYALLLDTHGGAFLGCCPDQHAPLLLPAPDDLIPSELGIDLAPVDSRGFEMIDLIAFYSCDMQAIEVAWEIRNSALVMVASEEETGGWRLDWVMRNLVATPSMRSRELGTAFVDAFAEWYSDTDWGTLSAIELPYVTSLAGSVEVLGYILKNYIDNYRDDIASARMQTQDDPYWTDIADLYDFADELAAQKLSTDRTYVNALNTVRNTIDNMMVAEWHQPLDPPLGWHGLTIYFPESFYHPLYDTTGFATIGAPSWKLFLHQYIS